MNILFYLALMIVTGLLFGKLAGKVKLPNVTGYIVGGLLVSTIAYYVTKSFDVESAENLKATVGSINSFASNLALGFIALSVGASFKLSYFKRVGAMPIVIAIFEGVMAIVFVTTAMMLIVPQYGWSFALVIGAIASATAPAATIMVIKQYKAKGPVTETLLSVVALDDAVALMGFGFAVAAAKAITATGDEPLFISILKPFIEIGISLIVGGVLGALMCLPIKWFKLKSNRLCVVIGFVFLAYSVSEALGGSSLLTTMIMSGFFINLCDEADEIFDIVDNFTPPIFMLFFVSSGANLDVSIIPLIGVVGVIYVVFRVLGKMFGAWFGAVITNAPKTVKKYLGPALVPQAGVAIGLSLVAYTVMEKELADQIRTIILCGTLIYELLGPVLAKISLKAAGEIKLENN